MTQPIDWGGGDWHPVVHLPDDYDVLDLTAPGRPRGGSPFAVGRYDEDRRGMYEQALFEGARTLHVGVDLGGPAGTPVHAFADGVVHAQGALPAPGDYGHAIVTRHTVDGRSVWALHGHLSAASVTRRAVGEAFARGDVLGELGDEGENGGWPPHLHFQLSLDEPAGHDLPGVVDPAERAEALARYPDPRLVLGPLW